MEEQDHIADRRHYLAHVNTLAVTHAYQHLSSARAGQLVKLCRFSSKMQGRGRLLSLYHDHASYAYGAVCPGLSLARSLARLLTPSPFLQA